MIVTIFVILLTISIFLIALGYAVGETAYSIIGFFFLFLLSVSIILPGNLEYKTGTEQIYEYGSNFTDYHWDQYMPGDEPSFNPSDDVAFLFHVHETDIYTAFDNASSHWFGLWLSIISGLGIAVSLVDIKRLIGGGNNE